MSVATVRGQLQPRAVGRQPAVSERRCIPGTGAVHRLADRARCRTGKLQWYDQVTHLDIRDHDFEATPMLVTANGTKLVIGGGKGGHVIAWNRDTRKRVWETTVGVHRNDTGPLPRHRVTVCPGLYGGIETPMAYASGRVFVPVVNLCGWSSAISRQSVATIRPSRGRGEFVALDAANGHVLWDRHLPSPDFGCATAVNDIVFTSTWAGMVYAFAAKDGKLLWHRGCPPRSTPVRRSTATSY